MDGHAPHELRAAEGPSHPGRQDERAQCIPAVRPPRVTETTAKRVADHKDEDGRNGAEHQPGGDGGAQRVEHSAAIALPDLANHRSTYPPAGPNVMVYVSEVDSDDGSVTVAVQLPDASSDASMPEAPPALSLPLGHDTAMVRYVSPAHTTEITMAPLPVNPNWLEASIGGSRYPCS